MHMILNQVTIPCTDYAASVAFYRRLGLVQIVASPPRYARFESASGDGATLSLHAADGPNVSPVTIYFDHESPEALDNHVEALRVAGLVFDSLPADQRWGWREARLRDPAGNEICLMHAGHFRRFPDWRINPD